MKKDMLKDHLNWDEIMKAPRYAGGHEDVMNVLFKGATVLASYVENDYQGSEGFVYALNGEFIFVVDWFGSCSGCDAWEDASDSEAKLLCTELANNAQRFDNINDLMNFLEKDVNGDPAAYYAEGKVATGVLESLKENICDIREYNIESLLDK